MTNSTDLSGRIFGDLTVIELATKDKNNQTIWKCQCICGFQPKIRRGDLVAGKSKSCGCSKRRKK
jgi:hypothetical protein